MWIARVRVITRVYKRLCICWECALKKVHTIVSLCCCGVRGCVWALGYAVFVGSTSRRHMNIGPRLLCLWCLLSFAFAYFPLLWSAAHYVRMRVGCVWYVCSVRCLNYIRDCVRCTCACNYTCVQEGLGVCSLKVHTIVWCLNYIRDCVNCTCACNYTCVQEVMHLLGVCS